ncbi:MAG: transcription antitermination factor NusB [bacterium]
MAISGRRLARRCAVQALYQWRLTGQAPSQIERSFIDNERLSGAARAYFLALIADIPARIERLDALIAAHSNRESDRLDVVEQAILRLGAYELACARDVPARVVLDEAIDLAKAFGTEHGYKYVNGVLDKIARAERGVTVASDGDGDGATDDAANANADDATADASANDDADAGADDDAAAANATDAVADADDDAAAANTTDPTATNAADEPT